MVAGRAFGNTHYAFIINDKNSWQTKNTKNNLLKLTKYYQTSKANFNVNEEIPLSPKITDKTSIYFFYSMLY